MRRPFLPLAGMLLLGMPTAGLAQDYALPPEGQVIGVLDHHPNVEAARARVESARAAGGMLRAGAHEVTLSGSYMSRDVTGERRYNEFDATVSRAFRLPGKAALDRESGKLGVEVAQNRAEDVRHQTALTLSQLWFDWLGYSELYRGDLINVGTLEKGLKAVERRAELRDAAQLEVDQARAALDQAQAAAAATLAQREEARALLAANFPDLALPQDAPALGDPVLPPEGLAQLYDLVIARSHEIRAADKEAQRLDTVAHRAKADRIADPQIGLRAFRERDGLERGAGVVLSMPLGGGYRKSQAEMATAEAGAARLDLMQARRTVEAMARTDLANVTNRMAAWDRLRASVVSATAATDRTARGYDLGVTDLSDLLLARRQLQEAVRGETEARAAAIQAIVKVRIDSHSIWQGAEEEE